MRQWWPSASSSRSPTSLRQREQLLAQPQPLVEVVDVHQRGVARLERDQQRARVAEPVRHLQRLGAERASRSRLARTAAVDQPRAQLDAEQVVARRSAASASSSSAMRLGVDHARLGVAAGEAERGLGERVAVALLAGELRGGLERRAGGGVAGAQLGGAEREPGRRGRRPRAGSARPPPRRRARRRPARRRRARSRRPAAPGPRRSGRRARPGWRRRAASSASPMRRCRRTRRLALWAS